MSLENKSKRLPKASLPSVLKILTVLFLLLFRKGRVGLVAKELKIEALYAQPCWSNTYTCEKKRIPLAS